MVEEEDRFGRKQWKYLDKVNKRDAKKQSKIYERMALKGIEMFVLKRDILCFIKWKGL